MPARMHKMGKRLLDVGRFGALVFLLVSVPGVLFGYGLQASILIGVLVAVIVSSIAWPLFVLR